MATRNPYQAYQNNAITTASSGELTLMLYNGCLKFIHLAKKALENKNMDEKNKNIQKAQNIIRELMVTLDTEKFAAAEKMLALYDFMLRELIQANIKNDSSKLDTVEELVADFRDTWKQVIQLNRQQTYGQGGKA
ncbi:flagellar protein FliS [Weizmannia acidilactici]|uniref:Flagellar secretion chaperone FliS n=1 Tax=Weizmannia acidilactici TaxID=2607726 RepID=A0A5J4JEN2_9BACI|nr:flagellar export chaperone FliS [Weizmannia acidilactici]GER65998.1 flagellar protein FliS [Weizmannia acidilactici]GER68788.1 flagellar protein FliS [Weizmannia acidilactici]GER72927.1 flagellar protein FliS [Weizmannia acidilactici]